MKRLCMLLSLAACAAALAADPAAAGVMTRAEVQTGPPPDIAPPPMGEALPDIYFNTGGEMFTPPTLNGSASGWSYYILHRYTPIDNWWWRIDEFGFPTNEYTSDPIAMPVEWVADLWIESIYEIPNPYSYTWAWRGDFYPTGAPDTSPPDTYTVVDISSEGIYIGWDQTLTWGYENAGLCGQIEYNGVETIGWYISYWDSDVPYGRTSLMQLHGAYHGSATEERSLSAIKSLY